MAILIRFFKLKISFKAFFYFIICGILIYGCQKVKPQNKKNNNQQIVLTSTSKEYNNNKLVYKRGSKGERVKEIQKYLNINADGVFGMQTERAVMKFQKENNLTVDGIVGKQTLNRLELANIEEAFSSKNDELIVEIEDYINLFEKTLSNDVSINENEIKRMKDSILRELKLFIHSQRVWEDIVKCKNDFYGEEEQIKLNNSKVNFRWPLNISKGDISSGFGYRKHPINNKYLKHKGLDIAAERGTKVFAPEEGFVYDTDFNNGHGNYIIIDHGKGYRTILAHLNTVFVKENEWVDKGMLVGTVGQTGFAKGYHLHLELIQNGKYLDPENYITKPGT